MTLLAAMKMIIVVSVIISALALALRTRADQALHLFRRPFAGLRAFLAMYVIVPLAAVLVVRWIDPRPGVALALLVLSLSPVPPLLPKKQLKSGGDGDYIVGLLVAAAGVSLLLMPLALPMLGAAFGHEFHVSAAAIAKTLAITVIGPLLLGLVAQHWLGARAEPIAHVLSLLGLAMLVIGGIGVLVVLGPALWNLVGQGTLIAMVLVILVGLGAGYWLGGPSPGTRSALALAAATRHPGVAMGVIGASFPDAKLAMLAVLVFVLLNVIVGIPFVKWVRPRDTR